MAKKQFGIADAIRGEIKTPIPSAPEVKSEESGAAGVVASPAVTETPPEAAAPVKATQKRGRGRPKKDEERSAFVRAAVTPGLKEKLHIICRQKNMTESDYTFELLKKAVNRDFEQAFSAMREDVE